MSIFKPKPSNTTKKSESGFDCSGGLLKGGIRLAPDRIAFEGGFYEALRDSVPIIDACISKIVRLTGEFKVICESDAAQSFIDDFVMNVPVGISGSSLSTFSDMYLDTLLTYGKCIGEYVVDNETGLVSSLMVFDPEAFRVSPGKNSDRPTISFVGAGRPIKFSHPERILYTALNPTPKSPQGRSLLKGIPALADVLMSIYSCIGTNFDRAGNVRYAVTYKPTGESDMQFARQRAQDMAKQWTDGMQSAKSGVMKDFIAVGDVDIKVIGAESGLIDTEVPVRQIIEQMISKLSIPPFLLGLNWSSTERMASQQSDILTSELEYYRRLMTPVLTKICRAELSLAGLEDDVTIEWANINLQDEETLARARLYNAQAEVLGRSSRTGVLPDGA